MQERAFIFEHLFLAAVALYFVLLRLYGPRIRNARFVSKNYWKLRRLKRDIRKKSPLSPARKIIRKVFLAAAGLLS